MATGMGVNASVSSHPPAVRAFGILERGLLPLFYLVPPSHSSFETLQEVPNYLNEVMLIDGSWTAGDE